MDETGIRKYADTQVLIEPQQAIEELGAPYDALSAHIILAIDAGQEKESRLAKALQQTAAAERRYTQRTLYLSAGSNTPQTLQQWLRMERPDVSATHYEEMLRLRSVIIDWDHVIAAGACCLEVRIAYPCLALFVVTEQAGQEVRDYFKQSLLGEAPRIYSGADRYRLVTSQIGKDMDSVIDWRYETPYWDSLRKYASHPVISFHALPLGQSRSLSQSLMDFAAFYGDRHFAAETSLATSPLDSLLNPRGAIKQAQAKAAYAFGAQIGLDKESKSYGTRFVTNGTSSANGVVISAFVNPQDYVLMERTCHISHYHALATVQARPVLMETFQNPWGAIGPAPLRTIASSLGTLLDKENCLPAVIILTNPTFDGIFYKPVQVIKTIHEVLSNYWRKHQNTDRLFSLIEHLSSNSRGQTKREGRDERQFVESAFRRMVFLFDEAWSARAYFHPRLIEYTAMRAAWDLYREEGFDYSNCLRFYATQSTHKSLSALRQGSMIHFRDPLMESAETRQSFEQAFRAHCTTSPSASIIASLDVARRQAQLEGALLIERCMRLAEDFRRDFAENNSSNDDAPGFFVLSDRQMMCIANPEGSDLSADECFLDPTHITLSWNMSLDGEQVRQLLLKNAIQVNKYNKNSVLAIFNIGIDKTSADALRTALMKVSEMFRMKDACDKEVSDCSRQRLPACPGIHENRDLGHWLRNPTGVKPRSFGLNDVLAELKARAPFRYIAAAFVVPYPPGYPILIPGQVITTGDIEYLQALSVREVFGLEREDDDIRVMLHRQDIGCEG